MSEGTIARPVAARRRLNAVGTRLDRYASGTFILPAVLIILAFSIFPLVARKYVSIWVGSFWVSCRNWPRSTFWLLATASTSSLSHCFPPGTCCASDGACM